MAIKKNTNKLILNETSFLIKISNNEQKDILHIQFVPSLPTEKNSKTKKNNPLVQYPTFEAKPKELLQTPSIWYVGVGSIDKLTVDSLSEIVREISNKVSNTFEKVQLSIPSLFFTKIDTSKLANIFAVALSTSNFPVDLLKTEDRKSKPKLKEAFLIIDKEHQKQFDLFFKKYQILSKHMNNMRYIQALPGNYLYPESTADWATLVAKKYNLDIKIFDKKALTKMGAGGILAVSQGSAKEPRMIVLEYKPKAIANKKVPTLALVGKGVTFDTGGISLKPGSDMHEMKYDMSGSAAVLNTIAAIAELKLPIHVVGVVGMVENMPGHDAFKPGDVYTSLKGLTIEVQNTDAEGRLILGDLLYYTEKTYKPTLMLNLATLTGAVVVALGQFYAGVFSRHKSVVNYIQQASDSSLEPVWHLPMGKRYQDLLKSDIADYNNIGGRYGGSSSAASFLSLFVEEKTKWAHLDIAGIAYLKSAFQLYHSVPTGFGVRLLVEIAEQMIKDIKSLEE